MIKTSPVGMLAVLVLTLVLGGCGGQPKAHVRGKVTLDGKPLADGTIQFFPIGGNGQTAAIFRKAGLRAVVLFLTNLVAMILAADRPDDRIEVLRVRPPLAPRSAHPGDPHAPRAAPARARRAVQRRE